MAERNEPARRVESPIDRLAMTDADRRSIGLAEAQAEADEKQLDESPIPGGVYLSEDGETYHNAHGERVDKDGKVLKD